MNRITEAKRAELYARAVERMAGLTAGLTEDEAIAQLDVLAELVHEARARAEDRRARALLDHWLG